MLDHPLAYIINLKGGENLIEIPERETKMTGFDASGHPIEFFFIVSVRWFDENQKIISFALHYQLVVVWLLFKRIPNVLEKHVASTHTHTKYLWAHFVLSVNCKKQGSIPSCAKISRS